MTIIEALLTEFDREAKGTRALLERVPVAKGEWTPHPKSRTLLQLATHVADIPGMATRILTTAEWDGGAPRPERPPVTEVAHLLARFDEHAGAARAALAGTSEADLAAPWTFRFRDRVMFTLPRMVAIRNMCLNHLVHHRGQLTVYLRLQDVPLPSLYGPTADEAV